MDVWVEGELAGCEFPDQRLQSRLGKLLGRLSGKIGDSLPAACRDWAATKAAYRFLDNPRVNENRILAGHFQAAQTRFAVADGPILVLHDTTEFHLSGATPKRSGGPIGSPAGIRTKPAVGRCIRCAVS